METEIDPKFIDFLQTAFREGDARHDTKLEEAENVRLVEMLFRVIISGNFDAMGNLLTEDAVLEILGPPGVPFAGSYQGPTQIIETTRQNFSLLESQRPEILQTRA